MADTIQHTTKDTDEGDILYLWKIPIDRSYVKSVVGILKVVMSILSLIAFICCASSRSTTCDDRYSSTYNYFEFVSMSTFIIIILLWFFFVVTMDKRLCFKQLPWPLVELVFCVIYSIMYLIADIVLAAQSCDKDSNKAGAAFGFFTLFVLCAHAFFNFKQWRDNRRNSSGRAGNPPEHDTDHNMDSPRY